MDKSDLEKRTKAFALRIINYVTSLPKNKATDVIGYQLLKSGTSIGANYREANRAESRSDFKHKIGIVEKEASECQYWLEICHESDFGNTDEQTSLLKESAELLAIFTAMGRTTKSRGC